MLILFILNITAGYAFQLIAYEFLFAIYLKKRTKPFLRGIIMILPFLFIYEWLSASHVNVSVIMSQIGIVLTLFYSALCIFVIFKCTLQDILFCVSGAYAMQNLSFNITRITHYLLKTNNAITDRLCNILYFCIIYLIFYLLFYRKVINNNFEVLDLKRLLINSGFILIMASFLSPMLPASSLQDTLYFCIYAIAGDLLVLFVQFGLFNEGRLKKQSELFEHLLYADKKHHELNKEAIETINMKCHDLRHQLSLLKETNNSQMRTEYIHQLEHSLQIYDQHVKTGNDTLDVVLMEKLLQCERDHIMFTHVANGSLLNFMNPYDIASLFGNAIENAIEASLQLDEKYRSISLRIASQGKLVKIEVINYYSDPITFDGNLPVSSKDDSRFHGYGVHSINHIVDKYNGTLSIHTDNDIFQLDIIIPISYDNRMEKPV